MPPSSKRKQPESTSTPAPSSKRKQPDSTSTPCPKQRPDEVDKLHETEYLKVLEVKKAALLGYATMSFADMNDMGLGLTIELRKYNPRVATPAQINALRSAVGGDPGDPSKKPSCLNRFSPDHAMFMMVKKKHLVLGSLIKDPFSSTFNPVKWSDLAKGCKTDMAYLINGNTRRELCISLGAGAVSKLEAARTKLANTKGLGTTGIQDLIAARAKAAQEARQATSWIVAFFDQDFIEKSSYRKEVLFELSKNRPAYQVPDSEAASLQLAVNYVLSVPAEERLAKVQQASSSESHMLLGMPKRLQSVFKDTSLFMAIVRLNPYSVLWRPRLLPVNTIYKWRQGATVFMEAIILQGVSVLDFLTSGPVTPEGLAGVGKGVCPAPVPDVLNAAFFDVVDEVYKAHLYKIRESFGLSKSSHREQEKWARAMKAYWAKLGEELPKWATKRKAEIGSLRADAFDRAPMEAALDRMSRNLVGIANGLFNTTLFGMEFPTPAPLLSPMFLLDVSESVTTLKPYLELAWRWIDPYLMTSSACFHSYGTTLAIVDCLDRHTPKVPTLQVVWAVASVIFCMRTDALVALRNADAGASPAAPVFGSIVRLGKEKASTVVGHLDRCLRAWREASPAEVINTRGLRIRDLPEVARTTLSCLPKGVAMVQGLSSTYLPWAQSPTSQLTNRYISVSKKIVQSGWECIHQEETYGDIPAFWVLRDEMKQVLSSNLRTGFGRWWDDLSHPVGPTPTMPLTPQHPDSVSTRGQLVGQSKANGIKSGTDKAIRAIIKILCTEDAGAIPVPIDEDKSEFRPFEEVHDSAMRLFEAMAVASFRAQSIYTDPGQERMIIISAKERKQHLFRCNLPDSFQAAPFDVAETHYAAFDADQLSGLDVFGPGSLAFQNRKEANGKKKKKTAKKSPSVVVDDDEDDEEEEVATEEASGDTTLLGNVLVKDTPDQTPDDPVRAFSSPQVRDDLQYKADIIKDFDLGDDDDIYASDIQMDDDEEEEEI